MLVRNWMSSNVITIDSKDSLEKANRLMRENKIRCLPVLNQYGQIGTLENKVCFFSRVD